MSFRALSNRFPLNINLVGLGGFKEQMVLSQDCWYDCTRAFSVGLFCFCSNADAEFTQNTS